jgi:hypothetical protein
MIEMPNLPPAACCSPALSCACGDSERVLRAAIRGEVSLSPEQRTWCLNEIGRVEGYRATDHELEPDADLAHTVLSAWTDYCRDKGLI